MTGTGPVPSGEGGAPQRRPGPYEQSLRDSRERVEALARERARAKRIRRTAVAAVVVVAAGGLGYGGWRFLTQRDVATTVPTTVAAPKSCADPTTVRIAVAPVIAPAVAAAAKQLSTHSDGPCAAYAVESAESYAVAGSLVAGRPDGWITDSTDWLARAKSVSGTAVTAGKPFASTAVVVAMPDDTARSLGDRTGWADLVTGGSVGAPDPNRSAVGRVALGAAAAALPEAQLRSAVRAMVGKAADASLGQVAAGALSRVVVTEAQLIAHNASETDKGLAGVAPREGAARIDYAMATITDDAAVRGLVAALDDYLQTDEARKLLQENGFGTPDGKMPSAPTPFYGVLRTSAAPSAEVVDTVSDVWTEAAPKVQALLAMDVSGSMLERGEGGSRLSIAQRSTVRSLAAVSPSTRASLWIYSQHVGNRGDDYRALVGFGSVGSHEHLAALDKAVAGLGTSVGGGSGLYDTIASAVGWAAARWEPGRTNTVVIVADGPNEDDFGITLEALEQRLTRGKNAAKPVRLVILGLGDRPDAAAMKAIVAIQGGEYVATKGVDELEPALTRALGG